MVLCQWTLPFAPRIHTTLTGSLCECGTHITHFEVPQGFLFSGSVPLKYQWAISPRAFSRPGFLKVDSRDSVFI